MKYLWAISLLGAASVYTIALGNNDWSKGTRTLVANFGTAGVLAPAMVLHTVHRRKQI